MSITSTRGHIAWANQTARVGDAAYTPSSYTWQRHRVVETNIGVNEVTDVLPVQAGSNLFTQGTFKNGAFVGGTTSIIPMLQGAIGHLLFAATGERVVTAATGSQSQITRFQVRTTDDTYLPLYSFRKYIPGSTGTNGLTEYLADCRVANMQVTIPGTGPVGIQFGVLGRRPISVDNESTTGGAFETADGLPLACRGAITLPGFSINGVADGAFAGARISLDNGLSNPQQEMVVGSFHPEDTTPLARTAMIELTYKWRDPVLYKRILSNGSAGAWSPLVQSSDVTIEAASGVNVPTFANPYRLKFWAGEVDWQISNPVLTGGQLLMCQLTGVVKASTTSNPTYYFDLHNSASYGALV
jgi:Phage tail tube protein